MNKIKILALFGESGAGKDSIQHWITKNYKNTNGIISCTTRPPRDYETDGKEYHFIRPTEFLNLYIQDKILEFTSFNDWYYGTPFSSLSEDKINIGVFNPQGVKELLKRNDLNILPVWIQVDDKIRLLRCLNREKVPNCEEICRRFLTDKKDFTNIKFEYEIYSNNNNNNDYYGFLNRPKIKEFIKGQI